jgi:hypothetical protein
MPAKIDNDAEMLERMGNAIIVLQKKFRESDLEERMAMRPGLEEMLEDHAEYEMKLLKEGVISTQSDLKEMAKIKAQIDSAANKQTILLGIARLIGFIAARV